MQLDILCDKLAELQVRRRFYIGVVNKQTNSAGALVRRALGWAPDSPNAESIKVRAARIVAAGVTGKSYKPEDEEVASAIHFDLTVIGAGLKPYTSARHEIELEMRRSARDLAVAPWVKGVRGFGELALAVIVGEAGDLARYPNPGKLWKRLGLAPLKGKAMSRWRAEGGLTAEDWTAAGYSPRRRAEIYSCLGDPLFRQQTMITGVYRTKYDVRRLRTAETHPEWTKGHSHNDALRIMTKQLILDLWSEWRRLKVSQEPRANVAAADLLDTRQVESETRQYPARLEQQAIGVLIPRGLVPAAQPPIGAQP